MRLPLQLVTLATRYWNPGESGSGYQAKSVCFLRWYSEIPFYCASNRHNMLNYRILLKLYYVKTLINALPNSLSNTFTQIYSFILYHVIHNEIFLMFILMW